jgi:hypothetical protein
MDIMLTADLQHLTLRHLLLSLGYPFAEMEGLFFEAGVCGSRWGSSDSSIEEDCEL